MKVKHFATILIVLQAPGLVHAMDWSIVHRHRTRPQCHSGIPDGRYQYLPRSRSEIAISRTAVLLRNRTIEVDAITAAVIQNNGLQTQHTMEEMELTIRDGQPSQTSIRRNVESFQEQTPSKIALPPRTTIIELYQLAQAGLQIDHCEISEVALQLHDSGTWVLSLRADQNRPPEEEGVVEWNPRLHIKRNEFCVRLRCLGAFQNLPAPTLPATGKPVLVTLSPEMFWVENGQPRYLSTGGKNALIREHFADIDRVEIEFFYR